MKKIKNYKNVRFSAEVLRVALNTACELATKAKVELRKYNLEVDHDDSTWTYDSIEEFFADFRKNGGFARFSCYGGDFDLSVTYSHQSTTVSMAAPTRVDIEAVFEIFENHAAHSALVPAALSPTQRPVVFVGHGQSKAWRDLKDHLQDKHGIQIEAYETGTRAGHTIRDILEDMILVSTFAILVMTGEDEQGDGGVRARQNVIHEAGLFQGRLGFARAILLLEEGVEQFSNVQGVQYISFAKGNIKETFGEVLATLHREFK
jgi:predicted nucleotide-binding protein